MRDELSSVQLIIQMLNNEQGQKDAITTQIQHVEVERTGDKNWNMIKIKCAKRRSEGNMKSNNNELLNTKDVVLTANRFTAVVSNSNTTSNEAENKSACENIPPAADYGRKREVKNPDLACSTIVDLLERPNVNSNVKLNLKTHSATQQHSYTKKAEGHPIPTLINGQISSKNSSMNLKQMPPQQKMKQKTTKMLVSSSRKSNKVLIIGDSHVRGLSEQIRNHLNIPFNVSGITKPNADTECVTSSSHFEAENLLGTLIGYFRGMSFGNVREPIVPEFGSQDFGVGGAFGDGVLAES